MYYQLLILSLDAVVIQSVVTAIAARMLWLFLNLKMIICAIAWNADIRPFVVHIYGALIYNPCVVGFT